MKTVKTLLSVLVASSVLGTVPAMAEDVESIVMLQRSPTYIASRPARDRLANILRTLLPDDWAYAITRWKNVMWQNGFYIVIRLLGM